MRKDWAVAVDSVVAAWCAGMFEGEGYIGCFTDKERKKQGKSCRYYQVQVVNTDRALLVPFLVFHGNIYNRTHDGNPNHSKSYSYTLRGISYVISFALTILPYIRGRKKEKLLQVLRENPHLLRKFDKRRWLNEWC